MSSGHASAKSNVPTLQIPFGIDPSPTTTSCGPTRSMGIDTEARSIGVASSFADGANAGIGLDPSGISRYASMVERISSRGSSRQAGSCTTPPQISLSWMEPSRSAIRTRTCHPALRWTPPGGASGTIATDTTSSRFLSMSAATISVIASHRATLYTTAHGFGCLEAVVPGSSEHAPATNAVTAAIATSRPIIATRRSRAPL